MKKLLISLISLSILYLIASIKISYAIDVVGNYEQYGKSGSHYSVEAVKQLKNGEIVAVGGMYFSAKQFKKEDYAINPWQISHGWIGKFDKKGNKIWIRVDKGNNIVFFDITPLEDGGFVVAGTTRENKKVHGYIEKFDKNGKEIWRKMLIKKQKTNPYEQESKDWMRTITQTKDGGFVVGGYYSLMADGFSVYSGWLIKFDKNGRKVWDKVFKGSHSKEQDFYVTIVRATRDGGFIARLYHSNNLYGNKSCDEIVKFDKDGKKMWVKQLDSMITVNSISQTKDGGYILGGYISKKYSKVYHAYIMKLNNNGKKVWDKTFGVVMNGQNVTNECINAISQTKDSGYIVGASVYSPFADDGSTFETRDAWVVKLDKNGNKVWDKMFGYGDNFVEAIYSVSGTQDGNYIIGGCTYDCLRNDYPYQPANGQGWIIEFNNDQDYVWTRVFGDEPKD